jgi:hypothetical protein
MSGSPSTIAHFILQCYESYMHHFASLPTRHGSFFVERKHFRAQRFATWCWNLCRSESWPCDRTWPHQRRFQSRQSDQSLPVVEPHTIHGTGSTAAIPSSSSWATPARVGKEKATIIITIRPPTILTITSFCLPPCGSRPAR